MADETVDTTEENVGPGDEAAAGATAEETAVTTAEASDAAGESSETAEGAAAAGEAGAAEGTESEAAAAAAREAVAITPDVSFVKELIASGGSDLKKCYQCATCSVACNLTPDASPFPRKEMMWAQWGLKEKLMGNPDIWLCHQCNDCTAQCPRGAKPGTVMNAVAKMTISRFSKPGFLTKGVGNPSALILMMAIPIAILAVAIGIFGSYSPTRGEMVDGKLQHAGDIVYGQFLGHWPIVGVFTSFFVLSIIVFALGIRSYWGALKAHAADEGQPIAGSGFGKLGPVFGEILTHKRFGKCDETEDRKTSHMFIFYAFALLFGATIVSTLLTDGPLLWGGEGVLSPYPTISVVKLFAYPGAIAGVIGIGLITINRFKHQEKLGVGSYFDWLLISVIILLMVTGILTVLFRLGNIGVLAYPTYFVHLSTVLFLFIYAPFSKMAHMVYRTTALAFARVSGRDVGVD
ncbi:MAG: quinone-interacting membrane-bound oxidoreductase complex subunit QmoC [Actinobacteria bacterium]|nr:quinone-interacting membrane-bound oxidoreductase complex subunit QmoC [Actinomycetota bacterium]MCL5883567.1 quinone-interacting membrane-bound oxidoreductase complex subunit QmoC [Actinomycetota bacterium]